MQKGSNPNITENAQKLLVENRGVLKNKIFLYLTEFFAGMSVRRR